MRLFTIGFTKKTAQQFFYLLKQHGVERIVDIRLHPDGQLAGFTKQDDLRFFLWELLQVDYRYLPQLAPNTDLLKIYRADHDWQKYETGFNALMAVRDIPGSLDRSLFEEKACCFLCSEPTPEHCHRRLVAERLQYEWGDIEIIHL